MVGLLDSAHSTESSASRRTVTVARSVPNGPSSVNCVDFNEHGRLTARRGAFIIGFSYQPNGKKMLRFHFYWFTTWQTGPAESVCK